MKKQLLLLGVAAGLSLTLGRSAIADPLHMLVIFEADNDAIQITPIEDETGLFGEIKNLTLTLSGPDEFFDEADSKSNIPKMKFSPEDNPNGLYVWTLTGWNIVESKSTEPYTHHGRAADATASARIDWHAEGGFYMENGAIIREFKGRAESLSTTDPE